MPFDPLTTGTDEISAASVHISGVLRANTALIAQISNASQVAGGGTIIRIFENTVPQGVGYPSVVYQIMGAKDVLGLGDPPARLFVRMEYLIKVIDNSLSMVRASTVYRLVDEAIKAQFGMVTVDGVNYSVQPWFRRAGRAYSEEREPGDWFVHVGGIYRSNVNAVP